MQIQPRLIRLRDAPAYLGMDRNRFNREVRPALTELRIGRQGVAFDRLEMDAWVDHYKRCNGRPARNRGDEVWDAIEATEAGWDLVYRQAGPRPPHSRKYWNE